MIKQIRYKNFKAIRDAILPLGRFTLIVGANGTGKTTAMKALSLIELLDKDTFRDNLSVEADEHKSEIEVEIFWDEFSARKTISPTDKLSMMHFIDRNGGILSGSSGSFINSLNWTYSRNNESDEIKNFRMFAFITSELSKPVLLKPKMELEESGSNLAGVLDKIQGEEPEKFTNLNLELNHWFPEYDRILLETLEEGSKSFLLRTKIGKHKIKAADLSHGTLLALTYLTVAYLPNPPKIVCFEEPERGIHPRLLRKIQEAMDRLAYPENYGEKREPVQVIATTHSPYLLDLYKDRREEIVIADKDEKGVHFERLSELPNIEKILQEQDAPLGDIWFSGILGGVPA